LAQARTFVKSVSLQEAMKKMGVVGASEVQFLEGLNKK
jgi:hypothetical protein